MLIRHLAGVLNNAVESKTVGGVTALPGLRKNRRKHTGLWPTDASQLMPYGLERSIQGYAVSFRLCRQDGFPDILLLFNKILAICGRSVIPHLLQFDSAWPMRITDLTIAFLQERRNTLGKFVDIDTELRWMEALALVLEFCANVTDLSQVNSTDLMLFKFVRMLTWVNTIQEVRSCGLLFVCDCIINDLPLFLIETKVWTQDHINQFTELFARFGSMFYADKPEEDQTVYSPEIVARYAAANVRLDDPLHLAFEGFA
ncbi:uncharacterized protein C8Q71DRAFT_138806 [Rhodofomes roseus]|uniref:Uncharacterized protein n=1 Tax=Rhodofomes roseus TaxID=34475 RepID=A0ABQ8KC79_9APHY|nr:uncharacterized protein C8Q71DRAFT_138806 [Rhodofomes roseus]KAH9835047.1 hypothetical protein C8Q71DRAFT_138806 [Rhodofomes roseus]